MKSRIILIRHVESIKNTLNACSSIDGKEPITRYGYDQIHNITKSIVKMYSSALFSNTHIYCAGDVRSLETASSIAKGINSDFTVNKSLSSFTNENTSGTILSDAFLSNSNYERYLKLYRAGLVSAWEVPWPTGSTRILHNGLERFVEDSNLYSDKLSIIVAHKSSLTCLALIILKHFGKYPEDFYGYVDIPTGTGILFEINDNQLEMELLDFGHGAKKEKTDVVIKNGQIVFPESACAICWRNDTLLLVQQNRNGKLSWELPGGKMNPPESPVAAALRELKEEAGYLGIYGKLLYTMDLDLSISIHKTHLVEFKNVSKISSGEFQSKWIATTEMRKMIANSEVTHAQTLLAFTSRYKI